MNLTRLLLIVFIVEVALIATGMTDIPGTAIYKLLTGEVTWAASSLITQLQVILGLVAGVGIIVGTFFQISELAVFATLAVVFLTFVLPLFSLFNYVSSSTNVLFASLLVGPIILIFLMTVIAFWRNRA